LNYNKIFKSKKLLLLTEYKELSNFYIKYAERVEENRNKFNSKNIIKDTRTGQIFVLKSDFKSYLNSYFNTIIQRLIYNKKLAEKENLTPYFITFTLPSEYHPFKTYNKKNVDSWELNENFKFNSVREAIGEGYLQLNLIFRYFYTYLKTQNRKYRKLLKNLRYNVFFEYHKSFLPHLHFLIYLPQDTEIESWLLQTYNKTIEKFNMNPDSNKLIKIENKKENDKELKKLDGAVLYISKYISKNLKKLFEIPDNLDDLKDIISDKEFNNFKIKEKELYKYIGWKTYHNIRVFRGNNTKIGIKNYSKIYYSLAEQEKKELLEQAKKNNSCLLFEIEKLITRYTKILDKKQNKQSKKIFKNDFKYKIIEVKEKEKKVRYSTIKELFKVVELFEKIETIDIFNFNFLDYKNFASEFNKFKSKIKRYLFEFDFYLKYTVKRYFTTVENEKIINRLLNNVFKPKIILDTKKYEGKEKIFKNFIKTFIKQFKHLKNRINREKIVKYKRIMKEIEPELENYYKTFKKWIDSDLSFASLFFRTDYKLIKYKIYKNNKELYNKDNFVMLSYLPF